MVQLVKCLLGRHEDMSSIPRTYAKSRVWQHPLGIGEAETGESRDSLASQLVRLAELQAILDPVSNEINSIAKERQQRSSSHMRTHLYAPIHVPIYTETLGCSSRGKTECVKKQQEASHPWAMNWGHRREHRRGHGSASASTPNSSVRINFSCLNPSLDATAALVVLC